jgi:H+/gluconate symporter-like permease
MSYKFEWNDLRAIITVVNVLLIMRFGLSIAWFGLAVACLGLIKDITIDKRINGTIMHGANAILNIYFLSLL